MELDRMDDDMVCMDGKTELGRGGGTLPTGNIGRRKESGDSALSILQRRDTLNHSHPHAQRQHHHKTIPQHNTAQYS